MARIESKIIDWLAPSAGMLLVCATVSVGPGASVPGMVLLGSAMLLSVGLGACLGRLCPLQRPVALLSDTSCDILVIALKATFRAFLIPVLSIVLSMARWDVHFFRQGAPLPGYLNWTFAKLGIESMQQAAQALLWLNRINVLMGLMHATWFGWRLGAYLTLPCSHPSDPLQNGRVLDAAGGGSCVVHQTTGTNGYFARTVLMGGQEYLTCYRSNGAWLATLPLVKVNRAVKRVVGFAVAADEQRIALLTALPKHMDSGWGWCRLELWSRDSKRGSHVYAHEKSLTAPPILLRTSRSRCRVHRLFLAGDRILLVQWQSGQRGSLYRWDWTQSEETLPPEERPLTQPGQVEDSLLDAQERQDGSIVLLTERGRVVAPFLEMNSAWRTEDSSTGERISSSAMQVFSGDIERLEGIVLDGGGVCAWDPAEGMTSLRWRLPASDGLGVEMVPFSGRALSAEERATLSYYDAIAIAPAGAGFRPQQFAICYRRLPVSVGEVAKILPINFHTGEVGAEVPLTGAVEEGWGIEHLQISPDGTLHGTLCRLDETSGKCVTKLKNAAISQHLGKAFPEDVSIGLWVESQRILSVIEDLKENATLLSQEDPPPLPILMLKAVVHENTLLLARRALQGQVAQQVAPVE